MNGAKSSRGGSTGLAVFVCAACALTALGQVNFDGDIGFGPGEEWGDAESNAVQDNYTGYGDQILTDPAVVGSELDQLYARTDGTWLYLGVTGNLQEDGNAIVILLDTDTTSGVGLNPLATEIAPVELELPCSGNGPPYAVQNLGQALMTDEQSGLTVRDMNSAPTVLDAGFEPDFAIAVDTFGGTVHVNQYDLASNNQPVNDDPQIDAWDDPSTNTGDSPCFDLKEQLDFYALRLFRGEVAVEAGNGTLTNGTNNEASEYAYNNMGTAGVTESKVEAAGSGLEGDPQTQTSGLEAKIHLAQIGYAPPVQGNVELKISVVLIGGGGLMSSQTLPGAARGTNQTNIGYRPDLSDDLVASGNQFQSLSLVPAAFSPIVDGENVVTEFTNGETDFRWLVASQDTVTSFLDRKAVCTTLTGGSELDELYMRTDGEYLYVGLTGNLEENGNAQIILLDLDGQGADDGQNVLASEIAPVVAEMQSPGCSANGPPGAVQGLGQALIRNVSDETIRDPSTTGTTLDAGFKPEHAIAIDTSGGTLHVSQYRLSESSLSTALGLPLWNDPATPDGGLGDCTEAPQEALDYFAVRQFIGEVAVNSSSGALSNGDNPNGSEYAYNNSNVDGVAGADGPVPPAAGSGTDGDPRSATRGLEAKISLADFGLTVPIAGPLAGNVMVLQTSGDGYVSNQTLPGINAGLDTTSLDFRPDFELDVTGAQYQAFSLAVEAFAPTLDGRDIVNEFTETGTAPQWVIASQDTVTGFGNQVEQQCDPEVQAGSEIDQIFVQDGSIDIAITGNLEANANQIVVFLDTVAGAGVQNLSTVTLPGKLAGMDDVLPNWPDGTGMQADYALVFNTGGGESVWLDLINIPAQTTTWVGGSDIDSGDGVPDVCGDIADCDVDWRWAYRSSNYLGVDGDSNNDPVVQRANAQTAVTGFEMSIPLDEVGNPQEGDQIGIWVILTNENASWLSNQVLPAGLGGGQANFDQGQDDFAALGYTALTTYIGPPPPPCNDPRYDADGDGDVDMDDYGELQKCFTGTGGGVPAGCGCFDWDPITGEGDGSIDLQDVALFELCAKGANVPADKTCDDPVGP